MFEEVGETALAVFLKNRSDVLGDVEICLSLGVFVVTDVVSQAVRQFADTHCSVYGQRLEHRILILRSDYSGKSHEDHDECCRQ